MRFMHPEIFIIVFIVFAGLCIFYADAFRRRTRALNIFASQEVWKDILALVDERKKRQKTVLMVAAVTVCLLAFMRPQWGFHWETLKRKGLDIIVAVDTSKSMLTEDIKPSRLGRVKLALRDMVRYCAGDRIGIIAFSGTAFLECPLTIDYNGFLLSIGSLDVETIPRGGTSLTSAIREAIRSFRGAEQGKKILILISDGEDLEGDAEQAAKEAKEKGIVIYSVGVGTKDGDLIPLYGADGKKEFLKDKDGNAVKSRLQDDTLKKIALETGGSYVHATGIDFGLGALYKEKISRNEKSEYESTLVRKYEDRFQILLAIALVLLLCEAFIGDRKRIEGSEKA
jgi:Ca-activated chloride channel homolog